MVEATIYINAIQTYTACNMLVPSTQELLCEVAAVFMQRLLSIFLQHNLVFRNPLLVYRFLFLELGLLLTAGQSSYLPISLLLSFIFFFIEQRAVWNTTLVLNSNYQSQGAVYLTSTVRGTKTFL
jgi:hypothetical protein